MTLVSVAVPAQVNSEPEPVMMPSVMKIATSTIDWAPYSKAEVLGDLVSITDRLVTMRSAPRTLTITYPSMLPPS